MTNPDSIKSKPQKFGRYTSIIGILLILLGSVGVIIPGMMSLVTEIWIAFLFLTGGIFWVYYTYKSNPGSFMDWLKPLLLIISGGFLLFYPVSGIEAVGLMLSFYLLLDAYGSFAMAHGLHPAKGWGSMTVNGVMSLILALLFLIGWPASSLWLVGLYVGISLFFDGWALLMIGRTVKKLS